MKTQEEPGNCSKHILWDLPAAPKQITIKDEILCFILRITHREKLEEQSTKQVAIKFGIKTREAYNICDQLAKEGLIEKLDPVNGDRFDCCGWIRKNDLDK